MTDDAISPVEAAFEQARASRLPLDQRLALVAEAVREEYPDYMVAVDNFVERLRLVGAESRGPQVGSMMPAFALPDQDGNLVTLDGLLEKGPVAIVFHRGHWCPFCRLNMAGIAELEDKVRPANIVAISAQLQRYSKEARAMSGASFPFLTDLHAGFMMALGIAVWIDDVLAGLIAGVGLDIPLYQGGDGWVLPIPSVFVLDKDGFVQARHVDPDFRRRMDLDELAGELEKLVSPKSINMVK